MVGSAVTINRPLRPGDIVTSTWPTLTPYFWLIDESSSHVGCKALQAGHHGAKLQ